MCLLEVGLHGGVGGTGGGAFCGPVGTVWSMYDGGAGRFGGGGSAWRIVLLKGIEGRAGGWW